MYVDWMHWMQWTRRMQRMQWMERMRKMQKRREGRRRVAKLAKLASERSGSDNKRQEARGSTHDVMEGKINQRQHRQSSLDALRIWGAMPIVSANHV